MTDKKIDNGGFAFPTNDIHQVGAVVVSKGTDGMTLRDWFAGQADIPWNAVIETYRIKTGRDSPTVLEIASYRAELKYIEADAMIAARNHVKPIE